MPAGRPSKLVIDDELQDRIMTMVRSGAYPERAAVAAGVSERTHYYWLAKGNDEREHREAGKKPRVTWQVYLDYVDALDRAIAEAEVLMLGRVAQGGPNWQANMQLLERRFRDRWAAKAPGPAPASTGAQTPGTALDEFSRRREARRASKNR